MRNLPRFDEEYRENIAAVVRRFEAEQLPKLLEEHRVHSAEELDLEVEKTYGNSLEFEKNHWAECVFAKSWVHQAANLRKHVSEEELSAYYEAHAAKYDRPAKARWEELVVRFKNFPTPEAVREAMDRFQDRLLAGEPFDQLARAVSQGATAEHGVAPAWTSQGSLASAPVDEALFTLPVGELSPILEDTRGLSIVRVIERSAAGRIPLSDVEEQITEQIVKQHATISLKAYEQRLKKTPVWTIFDDTPQPAEVVGQRTQPTAARAQ